MMAKHVVEVLSAEAEVHSFLCINLEDEPFCLPPPLLAIGRDGEFQFGADKPETRIVGLWRLPLWPGWLYN